MSVKRGLIYVLVTVILVIGFGAFFTTEAQSVRKWLCDVFLCNKFIQLEASVNSIESKTDAIIDMLTQSGTAEISRKTDILLLPENTIWLEVERNASKLYVEIWIKGETLWETTSFGLGNAPNGGVIFDTAQLSFVSVVADGLTEGWNTVDANEITPGQLILGGYAGTGSPIVGKSIGSIARLEFNIVAGDSFALGLQNYADGIKNLKPNPYSNVFLIIQ